jgi:hypothetical protein
MILFQHEAKVIGDPLGEGHGQAGPDTDDLYMGNAPNPFQNFLEETVLHEEGVTSGEEHIADLGGFADVVDSGENFAEGNPGAADQAFARTETAIGAAMSGNQEQHPVTVTVDDPRNRRMGFLIQGVFGQTAIFKLADIRYNLPPEGIAGLADEAEVMRSYPHGISSADLFDGLGINLEVLRQLAGIDKAFL